MIELDFMLTRRCNASCPICFTGSNAQGDTGLKKSDIVFFLNRIYAQCDQIEVHFTGGEPCCFMGFYDLLKDLDSIGIKYQFVTNGTLLRLSAIQDLKNLKKVVFSLYGCESFHDSFVGIKGAFQKIVESIKVLSTTGINIQVNITCFDENIEEIGLLLQHDLFSRVGIIKLYPVLSKGRAERNEIVLTEELYCKMIREIINNRTLENKIQYSDFERKDSVDCANKKSIFIDGFGEMYPCFPIASCLCRIGNIKESSKSIFDLLEESNNYRCRTEQKCKKSLSVL